MTSRDVTLQFQPRDHANLHRLFESIRLYVSDVALYGDGEAIASARKFRQDLNMRIVRGLEQLKSLAGEEFGVSAWLEVTQDRVDRFAEATGDDYWIHTDPSRANVASPFGTTVAHGYLTLSLVTFLSRQIMRVEDCGTAINYGVDRVRFVNPVRVGSRVRARQTLLSITQLKERGVKLTNEVVVEIEGEKKPACIARTLTLYLP
jgi:acyl dehydratase